MEIKWFGQSCFLVRTSQNGQEKKIVIDPFSPEIGLKLPKLEADILLVTHQHYDHNYTKAISGEYFLIDEPGEYEVQNIFIRGIFSFHDDKQGKERGPNTIYVIQPEGEKITLCHLGDLGQKELTSKQIEQIGQVDILLIPVGGHYTIDAYSAQKVISQIEPRIVIPMHYFIPNLKIKLDGIDEFLKVMGVSDIEPQPKLVVRKEKMQKKKKIIQLKPR